MIHNNIVLVRAVFQKGLNFLVTSVENVVCPQLMGPTTKILEGVKKRTLFLDTIS